MGLSETTLVSFDSVAYRHAIAQWNYDTCKTLVFENALDECYYALRQPQGFVKIVRVLMLVAFGYLWFDKSVMQLDIAIHRSAAFRLHFPVNKPRFGRRILQGRTMEMLIPNSTEA
jgi:hypothetical protein